MRKLLTTAITALATGGALLATAGAASATAAEGAVRATCFGGAAPFSKPANIAQAPQGARVFFYTSNRCADINIKPTNRSARARVCFEATAQCNSYKSAPANVWTVIATNVRDGSGFRIDFEDRAPNVVGVYAA